MNKLTSEQESSHDKFQRELSEIPNIELYEQAKEALSQLCKTGGNSFTMHVPPKKTDFDIVFAEVLRRWTEPLALESVGVEEYPTQDELDKAAIDFVKKHCVNTNGDLTQETECFDAGAIWMKNKLLSHNP